MTTPKLAEAMAMGGAGGPIPVLVLPSKATDASGLPYSSWLDYCEVACSSNSSSHSSGSSSNKHAPAQLLHEHECVCDTARRPTSSRRIRPRRIYEVNLSGGNHTCRRLQPYVPCCSPRCWRPSTKVRQILILVLTGVLDRLARVGAAEAAAKHAALRRLSAAFTVVPGSTVRGPASSIPPSHPAPPRRPALPCTTL